MNIFKCSVLFYLLTFSNLYADIEIVGESIGKENLKKLTKFSLPDNEDIFLYQYSYSINPHIMTVLIAKSCDCDRDLLFSIDEEERLFTYLNKTGEYVSLKAKGFLGVLYSGAGDIYEEIINDGKSIKFSILFNDIYQYRDPDVDKYTADLFMFEWGKEGGKYKLLKKNKKIISLEGLSENKESIIDNKPKIKAQIPVVIDSKQNSSRGTSTSTNIIAKKKRAKSGSISLVLLIPLFGLLVLHLI